MISYLLVDDDDILVERLGVALLERGHPVWIATSGEAGLALAEAHQPDRAIVDLAMEGLGGLEVLERLSAVSPRTRAILLTGYGSIPATVDAVKLGAVDVVQKPADLEGILAAFERRPGAEAPVHSPPSLARAEWEHIQRVLADVNGNVSEAARRLGLHRRTLQRKLQKHPPKA